MSCSQDLIDVMNILSQYIEVSESLRSEIEDLFEFKDYKKNEFFFRPERPHENIALMLSGGMRHFVLDEEGNERTLDFCVAGELSIPLLNYSKAAKTTEI